KDDRGSGAYDPNGITQRGLRAIKAATASKHLVTIADVCLCEYTSHGHCGLVRPGGSAEEVRDLESGALDFTVENDASLSLLALTARTLAEAGADIVAPSDMMDGRIRVIRDSLDASGLENTPILSYASKFASAFYGPFREAASSAPQFGDRRTYQMDGANRREAMREIEQDIEEGADMVLMKPGMPYLDVLRDARDRFDLRMGAYQVSGEYSMLCAAFQRGWLHPERTILESLVSFRRAGADFIVSYFAKEAAKLLS
ncbi:MAG: porphobilinogen synthase, partial [Rhodospirillales bacterium]|nr:porphobilinogen synthase [Acetobacter sp.]